MLKITKLYIDHRPVEDNGLALSPALPGRTSHFFAGDTPTVSWQLQSPENGTSQTAFRVSAKNSKGTVFYDSGDVVSDAQSCKVDCCTIRHGEVIEVTIKATDNHNSTAQRSFLMANAEIAWNAPWIDSASPLDCHTARYFRKVFRPGKAISTLRLYACGIGYQCVYLNGQRLSTSSITPAPTDYAKRAIYSTFIIDDAEKFAVCPGQDANLIIAVGCGWRNNGAIDRTKLDTTRVPVTLEGFPMLTAIIAIDYADGTTDIIPTGSDWECATGPVGYNDIFNGCVFDCRAEDPVTMPTNSMLPKAAIVPPPGKDIIMAPELIPPVIDWREFKPKSTWTIGSRRFFDFGQNMAGHVRIHPTQSRKVISGTGIKVKHAEEIEDNGELFMDPLRIAQSTDTYVLGSSLEAGTVLVPFFTYHGFRYIEVDGLPDIGEDELTAVSACNDFSKAGYFECGSPLVNEIHRCAIATERANAHGLLTDCPQRDERMTWFNDLTVRSQAFPYVFESAAIYSKIMNDAMDEQSADGAITCTAPYIYGCRPADPVCTSFILTIWETYMHTGENDAMARGFDAFAKWEECLLAHSDDYIVNYSYYGDWAGPAASCQPDEGAESIVTPGIFMSTGYSYFNCRLLAQMATVLGKDAARRHYEETAKKIAAAMLAKWYNPVAKKMATGSQGCQAFAVWLGIIPKEDVQDAVAVIRNELRSNGYTITTGNLCTRYIFEVLSANGGLDDAWTLISKDTYPSFGYMIQNEATTIWERLELKKSPGMNSHCHPMYGSIYYWFYAFLAGIKPLEPGFKRFAVKPYCPDGLQHVDCKVETPYGIIRVHWMRRYGKMALQLTVPVGTTAEVSFEGQSGTYTSGNHVINA